LTRGAFQEQTRRPAGVPERKLEEYDFFVGQMKKTGSLHRRNSFRQKTGGKYIGNQTRRTGKISKNHPVRSIVTP
jgi:hypothetical protein